jgi:hypothetical protein
VLGYRAARGLVTIHHANVDVALAYIHGANLLIGDHRVGRRSLEIGLDLFTRDIRA